MSERERERIVAGMVGRAYLTEQKKQREQAARSTVAGVLKLFAQERRNDMSAEAFAEFLNSAGRLSRSTSLRKLSTSSAPAGITILSSTRRPHRSPRHSPAKARWQLRGCVILISRVSDCLP